VSVKACRLYSREKKGFQAQKQNLGPLQKRRGYFTGGGKSEAGWVKRKGKNTRSCWRRGARPTRGWRQLAL
jgi:hypothetical protein